LPATNRLVVQGVNERKKHQKQARTQARRGQIQPGIVKFEAPFSAANVMLVCPKCGQPARVGYQLDETGARKQRVCRQCKQVID
jgi:large subunit ribosomal protein L24